MSAGVNKAILIGNLGRDPELKYTPGGSAVVTFSMATTERFNDKEGKRQDRTEWHNIVAFGKIAEVINQYCKKGRPIYIEGRIQTRSWDDKESGQKKYRTEIVVNQMQLLGSGQGSSPDNSAGSINDSSQPDNSFEPATVAESAQGSVEDDLPF